MTLRLDASMEEVRVTETSFHEWGVWLLVNRNTGTNVVVVGNISGVRFAIDGILTAKNVAKIRQLLQHWLRPK